MTFWVYFLGWVEKLKRNRVVHKRKRAYRGRHRKGWMLPHPLSWSGDNPSAVHLITWSASE